MSEDHPCIPDQGFDGSHEPVTTLGKAVGRFSWAEAVALPVVQISEPFPELNDAHEALGFAGVRLLVGLAR